MKTVFFVAILLALATAACTKYKVTASSLNVRSGAGTKYKVVGSKKNGAVVCVSTTSNGWSKISEGWVSSTYLKKVSTSSSTQKPTNNNSSTSGTTQYVTASSLNLRKGPGTNYGTSGSYSRCQKVTVVSTSNGWAKLSNGKYASAQYLSKTNPCSGGSGYSSGSCSIPSGRKDSPRPAKVTSKSCNVVYYSQCDSRWAYTKYSTHTSSQNYCNSACGPTSMAMVVATLSNKSVIPTTLGSWSVSHGYRTYNSGTSWGFFCHVAKNYGLKCSQTSRTDDAVAALKSDKLVVASMGPGYWTSAGHFICLYDVVGDNIIAHDPAKTSRVKNTIASFKRESSQYWILSK